MIPSSFVSIAMVSKLLDDKNYMAPQVAPVAPPTITRILYKARVFNFELRFPRLSHHKLQVFPFFFFCSIRGRCILEVVLPYYSLKLESVSLKEATESEVFFNKNVLCFL